MDTSWSPTCSRPSWNNRCLRLTSEEFGRVPGRIQESPGTKNHLLTVASRHQFLNEHHWSISAIGPALDDQSQAGCLGYAYQLNGAVTGEGGVNK